MPPLDPPAARDTRHDLAIHGGRLAAARLAFPKAPEPWIDLSTGINPHAYPVGALDPAVWRRLPDPAALERLETAARACYGAPEETAVIAAPGTQALIQILPQVRPCRRVAILGFGYQGHAEAWRRAGADPTVVSDLDALAAAEVGVVINPNNPDGRCVAPDALAAVADRMAASGGLLIVDEAFADVATPDGSAVPRLGGESLLVLRSFGKFFGLAGIRLGFALGPARLCAALAAQLGDWAVSGPAIALGIPALRDQAWQAAARERLAVEAGRLDMLLSTAGGHVLGGTSLFRLVRHPRAADLFERLGRAGILVRPFREEPTWLRFGLPADEAAWERLARALPP
ncbi:MAG: threonine-phosphate decarboxylase [Caulobacteraceae bacterium]|nr:threonine-phosphate decarboxylase [Caulobacter sp.]